MADQQGQRTPRERAGRHPAAHPDDPAFAARVARMVYVARIPRGEVAAAEGCSETTLNRALRYAKEHGIVRYSVDETSFAAEDPALAQDLCGRFGLSHAIVVEAPQPRSYEPRADDALHATLGRAAAAYLRLIVRPGDHVATTGGRGVYCAAKALAEHPVERKNVRVSTVAEPPGAGFHDPSGPLAVPSVDARDAAFYFARGFGVSPRSIKPLDGSGADVLVKGIAPDERAPAAPPEVADIPVVIAIAGGGRKIAAISGGLALRRANSDPFITALCTDAQTARRLLETATTVKMQVTPLTDAQPASSAPIE